MLARWPRLDAVASGALIPFVPLYFVFWVGLSELAGRRRARPARWHLRQRVHARCMPIKTPGS
jgi:hypothetical protein